MESSQLIQPKLIPTSFLDAYKTYSALLGGRSNSVRNIEADLSFVRDHCVTSVYVNVDGLPNNWIVDRAFNWEFQLEVKIAGFINASQRSIIKNNPAASNPCISSENYLIAKLRFEKKHRTWNPVFRSSFRNSFGKLSVNPSFPSSVDATGYRSAKS